MIPQHDIDKYLGAVFGDSEPGATLHHLLTASAHYDDRDAFGLPLPGKLQVAYYVIDPVGDSTDTEEFINKTIQAAQVEAMRDDRAIYFAAFGKEMFGLHHEDRTEQAMQMRAEGKLHQHPKAVEVTSLYAACRDGRRWIGEHYLTGPKAGTINGPDELAGPLTGKDSGLQRRLIRAIVGLAA